MTTARPTTTLAPPTLYDAACQDEINPVEYIPVHSDQVTEASGIVASRRRPGWFWVHNDSGDGPRFFGVGPGGQVQVVSVAGAQAVDWEDIAPDHTAAGDGIWLADIGDNSVHRSAVVLYRVPEPDATTSSVAAASFTLRYPDGPHNAEALLRDPATGTLIILTKESGTTRIYTVDPPAEGGGSGQLRAAGHINIGSSLIDVVTGADVSLDRSTIAVRTYAGVWMFQLRANQTIPEALHTAPCEAPHAPEVQGEAVGVQADGRGYATISEGLHPQIAIFRSAPY